MAVPSWRFEDSKSPLEARCAHSVIRDSGPVMTVAGWLEGLGLSEYVSLFATFSRLQDLLYLTEADIRDLGVKNGAHRARLVSSLVMIRQAHTHQSRLQPVTPKSPKLSRGGTADVSPACNTSNTCCRSSDGLYPHGTVYQTTSSSLLPSPVSGCIHDAHTANQFSCCPQYSTYSTQSFCTDMLRYVWYHGTISRSVAESLVSRDGEFLVRDSTTQRGDFVLTMSWCGSPLHFVVNRRAPTDDERTLGLSALYHFEEDAFSSVAELIQWYVRQRKPITVASGAIPFTAVPRNSDADIHNRSASLPKFNSQPLIGVSEASRMPGLERQNSMPSVSKMTAVDIAIDDREPRLKTHQRVGSEPLLSPSPLVTTNFHAAFEAESNSEHSNLAGSDSDLSRPAPPKPSRLPTIKIRRSQAEKKPVIAIRNPALYEDDGKDYSDYDQVKSWPERCAPATVNMSYYDVPPASLRDFVNTVVVDESLSRSTFDPQVIAEHDSQFLTPDNRPLESSAVSTMKCLILDTAPAVLARHIALLDIDLIRINGEHDVGFGIVSGLELLTLPQGQCLRQDIIERYHCLRLFVTAIVLRCSNRQELVRMLHHCIQLASELRSTSVGDLFAFSAVMHALLSPPISRLTLSWLQLRQQFNVSSVIFETKLCSLQRGLDNASGALPLQSVTVPHILPLAEMLELPAEDGGCKVLSYDLDVLLAQLDMARVITAECRLYRATAATLLSAVGRPDVGLLDMLCTPTHMRLLWGSRGVGVVHNERVSKFEQVLNVLSAKMEPQESCL